MVRSPVRVPDAVGVNLTPTVQEAPAAIDVPQVLVCEKSPVVTMTDRVAAAVPVLFTVTCCALLVVLRAWLANVSELGETDRVAVEEPPTAGKTSKSDSWPAFHPVVAVVFARTGPDMVAP